jgi:hypothetical protein
MSARLITTGMITKALWMGAPNVLRKQRRIAIA